MTVCIPVELNGLQCSWLVPFRDNKTNLDKQISFIKMFSHRTSQIQSIVETAGYCKEKITIDIWTRFHPATAESSKGCVHFPRVTETTVEFIFHAFSLPLIIFLSQQDGRQSAAPPQTITTGTLYSPTCAVMISTSYGMKCIVHAEKIYYLLNQCLQCSPPVEWI